jgi:hypothetical protein
MKPPDLCLLFDDSLLFDDLAHYFMTEHVTMPYGWDYTMINMRSEPQNAQAETFITASRGCSICGSGPVSHRILPLQRHSSAIMRNAPAGRHLQMSSGEWRFGGVRRDAAITDKSLVAPTWMPVAPVVVPRSGSGLLDKASRRAERDPDQKKQHCDKAAHGETPFG